MVEIGFLNVQRCKKHILIGDKQIVTDNLIMDLVNIEY